MRWHYPSDTRFEIRALAVWGRTRYLSVTEAPHNIQSHEWAGKKHFISLKPEWCSSPRSSTFQAGSFNQCTRAPRPYDHNACSQQLIREDGWPNVDLPLARCLGRRPTIHQHWINVFNCCAISRVSCNIFLGEGIKVRTWCGDVCWDQPITSQIIICCYEKRSTFCLWKYPQNNFENTYRQINLLVLNSIPFIYYSLLGILSDYRTSEVYL